MFVRGTVLGVQTNHNKTSDGKEFETYSVSVLEEGARASRWFRLGRDCPLPDEGEFGTWSCSASAYLTKSGAAQVQLTLWEHLTEESTRKAA